MINSFITSSIIKMAINPNYEQIGKQFVTQYYAMFDDANQRANLGSFYTLV